MLKQLPASQLQPLHKQAVLGQKRYMCSLVCADSKLMNLMNAKELERRLER